jgi:four helix bundle protein
MHTYSFENLDVWQRSRDLVKKVYILTNTFPENEKYGLVSQIRRAAVSVSNNLAEGSARQSKKDQAHFTVLAYSSLLEVLNLLILTHDLEFIKQEELNEYRTLIEEMSNKLNALKKAQLR